VMAVSGQPLSLTRMGSFSSHWTVEGCFGYRWPGGRCCPTSGQGGQSLCGLAPEIHSFWPAHQALRRPRGGNPSFLGLNHPVPTATIRTPENQ
jgi:hypothetical protein